MHNDASTAAPLTAGLLTAFMADTLKMPRPTLAKKAEFLTRERLKTVAGRGGASPFMTPRDTSRMLMAAFAPGVATDAAVTVRAFMDQPLTKWSTSGRQLELGIGVTTLTDTVIYPPNTPPAELLALMPSLADALMRPTLDDALTAVIEAARDGSLQVDVDRHAAQGASVLVELDMIQPVACAWLGFHIPRGLAGDERYVHAGFGPIDTIREQMLAGVRPESRRFGDTDALIAIGQVLSAS